MKKCTYYVKFYISFPSYDQDENYLKFINIFINLIRTYIYN